MTPAEFDARVARCIALITRHYPDHPAVPAAWTRHLRGIHARNVLVHLDPEGEQAQVIFTVMGRLGLVVAE